jgi:hypothetical protein
MTAKPSKKFDRAVRIEVLRARAAIERESLVQHVNTFTDEINPLSWLTRMTRSGRRSWFKQTLDFLSHYPFVTSALSSMLLRKSSRVAQGGGVALVVLQAVLAQQERDRTPGL